MLPAMGAQTGISYHPCLPIKHTFTVSGGKRTGYEEFERTTAVEGTGRIEKNAAACLPTRAYALALANSTCATMLIDMQLSASGLANSCRREGRDTRWHEGR